MIETKVTGYDISSPFVIASGVNISVGVSGSSSLGTAGSPFSGIYATSAFLSNINNAPVTTTSYFTKPSGTIDGINDTFTLTNTPVAGLVFVFENGIRLTPSGMGYDVDYTVSGNSIVFTTPPPSGSKLVVDYTY